MNEANERKLSTRTFNVLARSGVTSDEDLKYKLQQGFVVSQLGATGIKEIEDYLGVKIRQTYKRVSILTIDYHKMKEEREKQYAPRTYKLLRHDDGSYEKVYIDDPSTGD